MPKGRLSRTVIVGTCKPGKEWRASEEIMDLLMPYDNTVQVVEYTKGVVAGSTALSPELAASILEGKVTAYLNYIYLSNEVCKECRAMRKGCALSVEEGKEGICIGKAVLRLTFIMKVKGGIIKVVERLVKGN